jgi:regulator of sirC expression with transglutaminase-like and TPR domain
VVDTASSVDAPVTGCPGLDALVKRAEESVTGATTPIETIERLNHFFFQSEKFQVTYDLSSSDHLLLGPVIAGKRGYCVGLATIYLILAEELDLPIHAVATPKHVFLRWDDGKLRRNIELFQEGREVPDKDYIREQKIPQASIDRGVFLANLTDKEFLGFIYQNLGVLESQRGEFEESGKDYSRAIHFNPKLAAAYYNRGNDELKQKGYKKAIRDYTKALKLYPTDAWALWNRGLSWKGLGENEKAEEDQALAKEIDPTFHPTQ